MQYRRRRKQRGGEVPIKFNQPEISETSVSSAIKGSIQTQKENNAEMSEMNKQVGGGDVTVPQMDQAGESGNKSISNGIANILKGSADSEYDGDIETDSSANSDYIGGRRKTRRRKRKCCKCTKKCKCRKNFLKKSSKKRRKINKRSRRKINKRSRRKINKRSRRKLNKRSRRKLNKRSRRKINKRSRRKLNKRSRRKLNKRSQKKGAGLFTKKNKIMIHGMSEGTIKRLSNSDTSFPAIIRAKTHIKSGIDPLKAHQKAFNNKHLKVKDLQALPKYLEWVKTQNVISQ